MTLAPREEAQRLPTRWEAVDFWLRSRALRILRRMRAFGARPQRWPSDAALRTAPIVAEVRVPIWRDADTEFILTAGKVQNLRVARRAFDGVVVPAGASLSFWRQLGKPTSRRGFVVGREVRDGCIIPTIGGGICQLSNALATCAARAGFELVERHRHSAIVAHDAETADAIDATVFWDYVDLKIRASVPWRIEVTLSASELIVSLRAEPATRREPPPRLHVASPEPHGVVAALRPTLRNCYGCDETQCFRHRGAARAAQAREAWLLDAWTPEFAVALRERGANADAWTPLTPAALRTTFRRNAPRDGFATLSNVRVRRAWLASLRRIVWLRVCARRAGLRQRSILDGQRWLALGYARRLRAEHTHLIVDQGLLPHLQLSGALAGRSYEVLAGALPMREIERRLDEACQHPAHNAAARATLSDFRADAALADAERQALSSATRVLTAHADVAAHLRSRGVDVKQLSWSTPHATAMHESVRTDARGAMPVVVFPASALARKGAYVLAAALRGMHCRLRVLGSRSEDAALWDGIDVEYARFGDAAWSGASVVALPAYIEHNPRALLAARCKGIPVVATPACGLDAGAGVTLVDAGDVAGLRAAVLAAFAHATR